MKLRSWLFCVALLVGCSDSDGGKPAQAGGGGKDGADASPSSVGGSGGSIADASAAGDPCPSGVLDGDYTAERDDDVLAIADCTEVAGDLIVTGDVTTASFPALTTVGSSFRILDTSALTTLHIPKLVTVTRDFEIDGNAALTEFVAPVLESASVIAFNENPALATIDVDALKNTGFVRCQNNDSITEFSVPLVEVLGVFFVNENDLLERIGFASLTTITIDGFIVNFNPVLTTLELPVLTNVFGDILIGNNPMFPTCRAEEIRDQIDDPTVPFMILGNDDSGTCP